MIIERQGSTEEWKKENFSLMKREFRFRSYTQVMDEQKVPGNNIKLIFYNKHPLYSYTLQEKCTGHWTLIVL